MVIGLHCKLLAVSCKYLPCLHLFWQIFWLYVSTQAALDHAALKHYKSSKHKFQVKSKAKTNQMRNLPKPLIHYFPFWFFFLYWLFCLPPNSVSKFRYYKVQWPRYPVTLITNLKFLSQAVNGCQWSVSCGSWMLQGPPLHIFDKQQDADWLLKGVQLVFISKFHKMTSTDCRQLSQTSLKPLTTNDTCDFG